MNGNPYITATAGSIAPNGTATVTLQFAIPTSGGISYNPQTQSGPAGPAMTSL